MEGDWQEVSFPEAIDFREGPGILAKDFHDEGVPLVRLAGLDRGGSVLTDCNYLDPNKVAKKWNHFRLEKGDILVSTSASLGRIAVVGDKGVGAIPYTGIIRMRPRDGRLIAPFIRYLLEGPHFQRQAEMLGAGSVIRHFGPTHLREMTVIVPPLPEQRAIAHILGTLDDKIELNRRMNETLEGMARALFKSWFVDFNPVRAKMDGRWQSGESLPGLPAGLYDLFPNRLVQSEFGEVPEGWEVGLLREFASMTRNSVKPQQHLDEVFAHYSIPAFDDGRTPVLEAGEAIKSNKYLVGPHSILVSKLNPRIPRVWLPAAADGPRAICSTEFLVTEPADLGHRSWFYCLLTSEAFQTRFRTLVTGTSGSHQRVRPQAYMALPIVAPPKELRSLFAETADALLSRSQAGRHESESLAALRSTLLPKLISGELRLREAEQSVEQAT